MKLLIAAFLFVVSQHQAMPAGMSHEEHLKQMQKNAELKKRSALAMGFDQDKVTHHFRATATGGLVEVEANGPEDSTSREKIRLHLKDIAGAFAKGDFGKPFETHAEVPPGVPVMQRLKAVIHYKYEDTPGGGAVRITTSDPEALKAVHDFLAYQRREHHAGA